MSFLKRWRIDIKEPGAASRFFWRVFQIVWFGVWIAFHVSSKPEPQRMAVDSTVVTDSAFVTDSALSTCARWTYSGVWANGKRITPRVEGATCATNVVQPMAPECKKVKTSHGPIMLCLKESEAYVGAVK